MTYEFREFQPDFLEKQIDLAFALTDEKKYQPQLFLGNLKKTYLSENFDTSTRHYVFKNGEDVLTGYIVSAIEGEREGKTLASIQAPYAVGYNKEVENLLIDKAISTLKEKNADKIVITLMETDNQLQRFKELNFEFAAESYQMDKRDVNSLNVFESHHEVTEYDPTVHKDIVTTIFNKSVGELFGQFFFNTYDRKGADRYSIQLILDGEEIIALGMLNQSDRRQKEFRGPMIFFNEEKELSADKKTKMMQSLYFTHFTKFGKENIGDVQVFIFGASITDKESYESLGFSFDSFGRYILNLS
ncbi:MAG: hypothetical protein HeimC2_43540 [Candidatus Heimdallarchaeota archaeon LC_2]|nr:MAG: hypothetical protein HeimC2_43540 [Candidatus Heimdallarchaeota archaeon LC_2]